MAIQQMLAAAASLVALILIVALQKALWSRRGDRAATALLGVLFSLTVAVLYDLISHASGGLAVIVRDPMLQRWQERIHTLWPVSDAGLVLASVFWLQLFLLYPEPYPWLQRREWLRKALYVPAAFVAAWTLCHPLLVLRAETWLGAVARAREYACTIAGGGYLLAGVVLLFHRMRKAREPSILGALRVLAAWASVITGLLIASSFLPQWLELPVLMKQSPVLGPLLLLSLPIAFGYAMVRYRWLDVEWRFGPALAYALSLVAVLILYVGLVELFVRLGGMPIPPDHPVLLAVLALAVTLGLHPLRLWLQERIDRFFERRRYDERRVLRVLADRLAGIEELQALARAIVDCVASLWMARTVALVLRDELRGGYTTREVWGLPPGHLGIRFPPDSPVVQEILRRKEPVTWKELVRAGYAARDLEPLGLLQGQLFVALGPEEDRIGWLQLGEPRFAAYSRRDRELLALIADRAGVAVAQALLNEQYRRDVAALELLSSIGLAASTLNVADLLEWIWRGTARLIGGDNLTVALQDEQTGEWHWAFVVEGGRRRWEKEGTRWSVSSGLASEVVRTGEPILVEDYQKECERRGIVPWEQEPELPATAWLGVPLIAGTRVLGVLTLSSVRKDFAYRPEHLRILGSIASQAAVAIEKAQARGREEERLTELVILNEIAQSVGTSIQLDEVLRRTYQAVLRVLNAPNFYVALYDATRREFSFAFYVEDGKEMEPPAEPWRIGEGLTSEVVRTQQPIVTTDYLTECARRGVVPGGKPGKAWLGVPMIAADEVVGVMVASSFDEATTFSADDVRLLSTIAAQVAGAVQNARRFEESQRRQQELAALVQIGTAISSSLDLQEVLNTVCREAVRLLRATSAYANLWEESRRASTVFAEYISPEASPLEQVSDLGTTYEESEELAALLREGKPTVWRVSDPSVAPDEREHMEQYGGKSVLFLPLVGRTGPLGFIEVWESRTERVFTEHEILLGQSLAAQAAIAIENARLYERTDSALARRVSELSTIEEISRELNRLLDLRRIIQVVLDRAIAATAADAGGVALLTEDARGLTLLTGRGYPPEVLEQVRTHPWSVERGIIGRVVRTGEYALVGDVRTDPDYVEFLPTVRSQLTVPIRDQERIVGAVVLESNRLNAFDSEHLRFVRHLADHAAIAMRNARLLEERERRIIQLSILNEIAHALSSTIELPELVKTVYRQVNRLFDTTNFYIALYDEREGTWHTAIDIERGIPMPPTRLSVEEGVTGYIIRHRKPVLLRSEAEDRAFHEGLGMRA
ncbi:MAG: GAF domain-containing protein, partial [Chloroflexia bacterium]